MNSNEKIRELLAKALLQLKNTGIDQGEILYWETEMGSIRTFLNRISHNGFSDEAELYVSSIRSKKMGQFHTTDLSKKGIEFAVEEATNQAKHVTPLNSFPVLQEPYDDGLLSKKNYFDATLQISPDEKIKMIQDMFDISKKNGLNCSANMMSGGGKVGIINTSGLLKVTEFTEASLNLILTGNNTISAYSSGSSENIETLNVNQIIQEAILNANRQKLPTRDPIDFMGKDFCIDLILEPYAVAEWIEIIGSIGLNGLRFEEGESFVSGKLNQRLLGKNITLYDDATDARGLIVPFDFEGVPKRKHILFENGIAKSACYDLFLGEKYHKKSTGHALPPFERSYGAIPRHLVMEGGNTSLEEMIITSEEPTLYITRFHYTNVVNPKEGILTGMTKDGTFLIRNGKIEGSVSNLRYLDSIPGALNRVSQMGEPRLVHDPVGYGGLYPESVIVPPLKIKKVKFIGNSRNRDNPG
ncbi:MAG: TldD/PmbA family protein [Nitrospiria bacterium]